MKIGDCMAKWKNVELGEVVTLKRGYDLPQQKRIAGTIPIFSSSGINGYHNTAMVKGPGVVTGRYGTIGQVFFADQDFWPLNTTLYVEDFHGNDPAFIYYFLKTLDWNSFTSASAVPGINRNTVHKTPVTVPDLGTQRKIASVFKSLDDKIALNSKINDNLEQQASTLYNHIFCYNILEELPEGWHIGTVREIVDIHDSKRVPLSNTERSKIKRKTYPYYGAASLMDYVDDYIFDGKYLLLGEDGTVVDDSGYPILQYVWGKFWVNNHAHVLTGKNGFNVESLYMLFKHTSVRSIVTGAVQPKISQSNLKSIQVVIPPRNVIATFNDEIEPLFAMIRLKKEENKRLSTLRDALLPKLMSGEIDVEGVRI